MIKEISRKPLGDCAKVIRASFNTVAKDFNITEENAPGYVAFAATEKKLSAQYDEGRKMFAYFDDDKIVGFYSLEFNGKACTLNNLCVLPEYRHKGLGDKLLHHCFKTAQALKSDKITISIVEENKKLKEWYIGYGFKPVYTKKYDFFPFTCGYMEKAL